MVIAVPKGRVLKQLVPCFEAAGVDVSELQSDDRRLVREAPGFRFLLLKPDDVPTYVEYGVADLGVVGRDVFLERDLDLYAPVDLGIGKCRLVVAGRPGTEITAEGVVGGQAHPTTAKPRPVRVATKFPRCAATHFEKMGVFIEPIFVQGSVELAPLTGLSDVIVDLVESGETLKQNGLVVLEDIFEVTSLLVANRVGLKLKHQRLRPLLKQLRTLAPAESPSPAG